ncbi:MAG: FtsW/RodA/SpoVE family cell cycle protein [Aquificae bacterium]|nr:FtsW/RodA/SpoVE family cell cycle protein [Aquificota bacterium]
MNFVERIYPDKKILLILLFFFIISQTFIFLKNVFPLLVEYHPSALLYYDEKTGKYRLLKRNEVRFFYDTERGRAYPLVFLEISPENYKPAHRGEFTVKLEGEEFRVKPYRELLFKKFFSALSKNVKLFLFFLVSLVVLYIISNSDYRVLKRKRVVYLLVTLSLLPLIFLAVKKLISPGGMPARWLFGTSIQPSEFSKIVIILFLAYYIGNKGYIENFSRYLWVTFIVLLHSLLLLMQPDLGMSMFFLLLAISLLWAGGVSPRFLYPSMVIFGSVGVLSVFLFSEHVQRRFEGWLDPFSDPYDKGYQIIKSLQALVKGGLFGEGLGKGLYAITYIRESDTDYIVSAIVENLGMVGFLLLLGVQVYLVIRLLRFARHIYGMYERLIILGVALNFMYSVLVNYAMAFNLLPPKGIALPFISYGVSNLLANVIGLGIVGSIYRRYLLNL